MKIYFKFIFILLLILFFTKFFILAEENLASKLSGRILLQVESHGEAWYINPKNNKRYFLGKSGDAFRVMREQGVGVTNKNLKKIPLSLDFLTGQDTDKDSLPDSFEDAIGTNKFKKDSDSDTYDDKKELSSGYSPISLEKLNFNINFADDQKGKILLQVESHGEAWYVNPENKKRYFLGKPSDAFLLMRKLGLGISNENLALITLVKQDKDEYEEEVVKLDYEVDYNTYKKIVKTNKALIKVIIY